MRLNLKIAVDVKKARLCRRHKGAQRQTSQCAAGSAGACPQGALAQLLFLPISTAKPVTFPILLSFVVLVIFARKTPVLRGFGPAYGKSPALSEGPENMWLARPWPFVPTARTTAAFARRNGSSVTPLGSQAKKVMTMLTIISFSAGRDSAIMTVSATSVESAMRLEPSLRSKSLLR